MDSLSGHAFFDSDEEDQGPNLKGEYTRGTTPPSHRSRSKRAVIGHPSAGSSTTSGHYSSDSMMSKTKNSKDTLDSRTRSLSPRNRSPSGSSFRYSDSFDSEASGDSRSGSPERSRRGGGRKSGGDSRRSRRFDSGTSRDSRPSTFRSTNNSTISSSGYGRPNKKAPQKTNQKKGRGRGRANSNASSTQNTPRGGNVNEVTRRMLSAKGHTINRLRNEFEVLKCKHDDLQREFKLQKQLYRKNERELDKYTKQEDSIPSMMQAQNSELEHYRKKIQTYRDKDRQKDHQLKQYNEKLNRTEDELKSARRILEDKGLKERADLQRERDALEDKLREKERKYEDLEKYLSNVKKNNRHERRDWRNNEKEFRGQIEHMERENERLLLQLRERERELNIRNIYSNRIPQPSRRLRLSHSPVTLLEMMLNSGEFRVRNLEKEKELEIKNIYSNRIVKPPGRLRTTSMSPTSLRPMMIHKSTTTDEIKLSPHSPAVETRRASSADERTTLNSNKYKSPRDERYKKQAEEQRQRSRERTEEKPVEKEEEKKELSEHERILADLDSGLKKPEETKPKEEEDDETMRILRQFDDHNAVKGNSQRQVEEDRRKEEERKREEQRRQEEEEERRKREEEERRRKEEENKKPLWLKGPATTKPKTTITSTSTSIPSTSAFHTPSTFHTPSAFTGGSSIPVRAPAAGVRVGVAGQSSQHKAATSKLPWLASDSPVPKPEEEKREREEQEAKLSNGLTQNASESEEDYPFFGSKPAANTKPTPKAAPANKQPFAVNSVRDLQKYSATRETSSTGNDDDDYNGLFATNPNGYDATTNNGDGKSTNNADQDAEERRKKDLLLARMRDIDDGKKPDSGRSRKVYNHSDPVKNMHNGKPSHPEVVQQRRKSIDDDLTFGSYAPSFTTGAAKPTNKGPAKKKNPFFDDDKDDDDSDSGFKLSPKHSPQRLAKKNNLMADLFGGNGSDKSDNPSRSSFGEETVFSSSTKAKPVADSGVYPWEKKVNVGQVNGGGSNNKPNNRGVPPQKSFSDDFDDDIEEMTL